MKTPSPFIPDQIAEAFQGHNGPDQQRIARVGLDWLTTLLAKNQDYGGSAWAVPTLCPKLQTGDAILVRMSDKISRITNLLRADSKALVDESIEDTIKDLGAYCLLWLARPKDQDKNEQRQGNEREAKNAKEESTELASDCQMCQTRTDGRCGGSKVEGGCLYFQKRCH